MEDFLWAKRKRLDEQLKFFKAKKKKFISVYAKKPRIVIGKADTFRVDLRPQRSIDYRDAYLLAQQDALKNNAQASGMNYGGLYGLLGVGQASAAAAAQQSVLLQAAQQQALNPYMYSAAPPIVRY